LAALDETTAHPQLKILPDRHTPLNLKQDQHQDRIEDQLATIKTLRAIGSAAESSVPTD
jgi:hypothetical protein